MNAKTLSLFCLLFFVGSSLSEDRSTDLCGRCELSYKKAMEDNTLEIREVGPTDGKCTNGSTLLIPEPGRCCEDSKLCKSGHGSDCRHNFLYENGQIRCDHFLPSYCPDQQCCGCCLNCNVDVCSRCFHEEGATCRKQCQWNEYLVSTRCHSPYCQCCRKCEIERSCHFAGGYCVGHPHFCKRGYYATKGGCTGDCCYCCRPIPEYTDGIDKTP
ncbi:uncharacterized protein LOC125039755 [Penaeus chinensis]|uniref:uncharacterized protein LOC125039755 n=1 Tax=Penaeus chinensis TaxID=139456 RepID=UPI001FB76350|nr:uncharacterized protein LOC125039755 [Penaeus chinensis]